MIDVCKKPRCIAEGCDQPATSRGMCTMHYARWHKGIDPVLKDPADHWRLQRTTAKAKANARIARANKAEAKALAKARAAVDRINAQRRASLLDDTP